MTPISWSVVTSPRTATLVAISRSSSSMILPERVFDSASMKRILVESRQRADLLGDVARQRLLQVGRGRHSALRCGEREDSPPFQLVRRADDGRFGDARA